MAAPLSRQAALAGRQELAAPVVRAHALVAAGRNKESAAAPEVRPGEVARQLPGGLSAVAALVLVWEWVWAEHSLSRS